MKFTNRTTYVWTFTVLFGLFCVISPATVFSKVGVGMGAGEIRLTDSIKPGAFYTLPNMRVFNTGDETTTYKMNIAYHQDFSQFRPGKDWFTFNPLTFTIEPGQSQVIEVTMLAPVKIDPGEYFAFIESGPIASNEVGTTVGVAVASKLFFTVVPANIWQAFGYRISGFFATYSPWSWIALCVSLFLICILLLRRFISFNIKLKSN